jgi:hypothetical protein
MDILIRFYQTEDCKHEMSAHTWQYIMFGAAVYTPLSVSHKSCEHSHTIGLRLP